MAADDMNQVAAEWLAAREVIIGFLAELLPGMGRQHLEHNAAAVIARLAGHDPPFLIRYADAVEAAVAEERANICKVLCAECLRATCLQEQPRDTSGTILGEGAKD